MSCRAYRCCRIHAYGIRHTHLYVTLSVSSPFLTNNLLFVSFSPLPHTAYKHLVRWKALNLKPETRLILVIPTWIAWGFWGTFRPYTTFRSIPLNVDLTECEGDLEYLKWLANNCFDWSPCTVTYLILSLHVWPHSPLRPHSKQTKSMTSEICVIFVLFLNCLRMNTD